MEGIKILSVEEVEKIIMASLSENKISDVLASLGGFRQAAPRESHMLRMKVLHYSLQGLVHEAVRLSSRNGRDLSDTRLLAPLDGFGFLNAVKELELYTGSEHVRLDLVGQPRKRKNPLSGAYNPDQLFRWFEPLGGGNLNLYIKGCRLEDKPYFFVTFSKRLGLKSAHKIDISPLL